MARSQEQSEVNPGPGGGEGLPGYHPQKFNVDTVPRIGKRDTGAFTKHHFGVFMLEVLGCKKAPNIWMGLIVLHVPLGKGTLASFMPVERGVQVKVCPSNLNKNHTLYL